ncbi:hypothetical protein [Haloferax sp. DFSO60]|uniref:hypothetical protein n=1 Tax=Haloferax sp. DFSO60 TaxID=3388652 RepID=UPI00397AFF21
MRSLGRAWQRVRRAVSLSGNSPGNLTWSLEWSRKTETRWRATDEIVDCFRFADGYVTTVRYPSREVTWQLTPGYVPLASALLMARLYVEYGLTPQTDPDGRPFIGQSERGPVQVFEEIPPEEVEYVYLDGIRTLEEFPEFVTVDENLETIFDRMIPARSPTS